METKGPLQRLCRVQILKLLVLIISLVVVLIILSQLITFPYKSYTLTVPPVTKGILVHEVAIYNNISIAHKGGLNGSKEEGCKGYDCDHGSLLSQIATKQNDSVQTDQTGQTVAVALEPKPTRFSYMVSVLESTVAARFSKNKLLSARDGELKRALIKIENGPMLGSTEGLDGSLYHNLSRFLRTSAGTSESNGSNKSLCRDLYL
ncbi:hypothetical protein L1987_14175 [Smallanthus sonchifolius]|uniref:Uncharacterized protein n=3 Tax=Smallanthus sonchifolius TaxID=185202 RepID=A0ACB9J334_9ASTR|nr:hypothetical protein L1987_14168 [Smallanthus sonchifolius]KAI3814532.1 hypothetical protein L1987_14172 [Smallanthus sonchifolius]KAI3814535.1 hypothetical protein L1987_14175 [Smallanthus sonchifolius]